jgi:small subunit ribosomal protein S21
LNVVSPIDGAPEHVEPTLKHTPRLQNLTEAIILAEIRIFEGESIESAMRRFKRRVQQEGILKEVRKHSFFLKPGEKKRLKSKLAQKTKRKKQRRLPGDTDPKVPRSLKS